MTRKEQIIQAANEYDADNPDRVQAIIAQVGFEMGARWADSHPHWISVEDELPKERDWYLIYDTNMGHDVCMWYGDCWGNCYKVTHWMPLPATPTCSEFPNNCEKGGEQ